MIINAVTPRAGTSKPPREFEFGYSPRQKKSVTDPTLITPPQSNRDKAQRSVQSSKNQFQNTLMEAASTQKKTDKAILSA